MSQDKNSKKEVNHSFKTRYKTILEKAFNLIAKNFLMIILLSITLVFLYLSGTLSGLFYLLVYAIYY